jgi:hypothetical protein
MFVTVKTSPVPYTQSLLTVTYIIYILSCEIPTLRFHISHSRRTLIRTYHFEIGTLAVVDGRLKFTRDNKEFDRMVSKLHGPQ